MACCARCWRFLQTHSVDLPSVRFCQDEEFAKESRIFWPRGDPQLISEGFFCTGIIIAFIRMLYICQMSQVNTMVWSTCSRSISLCSHKMGLDIIGKWARHILQALGPLQLSLGCMIRDTLRMLFIFLVFIAAFSMGLTRLYFFYDDMVRIEDGETQEQPHAFVQ